MCRCGEVDLEPRPGVVRIIEEAADLGLRVAVCSPEQEKSNLLSTLKLLLVIENGANQLSPFLTIIALAARTLTHTHTHIHTQIRVYIHKHAHTQTCIHTITHTHTCIHSSTLTCTHAHTHMQGEEKTAKLDCLLAGICML